MTESRGAQNTYLLIPILVLAILASIAVIRGPSLVSLSGFGSAIIVAAPLILALVQGNRFSPEELAGFRRLLDEAGAESKPKPRPAR